jgi:putative hydrolase of the HAD superfamily
MKKNIKAVVFDYSGVIEIYEDGRALQAIADLIGVPVDDFKHEYFKRNHLSNIQNIAWDEVVMQVVAVFDSKKETLDKVSELIKERESRKKINHELCGMFEKLRAKGFKVAILSNATTKLRDRMKTNGISDLVDEIVISAEIGFQKPHQEAFDVLFQKLGVSPSEVVFIDDAPKSLKKADEIGYVPILFENNEKLKIDLGKLGIVL